MLHTAILATLLSANNLVPAAPDGISVTASYSESRLEWLYAPEWIESACGSDLFSVEQSFNDARRVCLRRDAVSGRYEVTDSALIDRRGWYDVIRGPGPDRGILLWSPPSIYRYDPVTDEQVEVVHFNSPEPDSSTTPIQLFDREGDGPLEALRMAHQAPEIRSMTTGALLQTLSGAPWNELPQYWLVTGQFDSDASAEFAVFEPTGIRLYDAVTLQAEGPVISTGGTAPSGPPVLMDWDDDGRDEFVYRSSFENSFFLIDFNAATVVRPLTGTQGSAPYRVRMIDWTGDGQAELALLWSDRAAIYDPRSSTFLTQQAFMTEPYGSIDLGFDPVGAAGPTLLWTMAGNLVRWDQGTSPTIAQTALIDIQAVRGPVGASGQDAEVLTGDIRVVGSSVAMASFSRRDPESLRPIETKSLEMTEPLQMRVGDFHSQPGAEVFASNNRYAGVGSFGPAPTLWRYDVPANAPERVGRAAVPGSCFGAGCQKVLIGLASQSTASTGSYLALFDTGAPASIWNGPRDHCLGCGFHTVALDDLEGDGTVELLSAKLEIDPTRESVVLRDGATQAIRWTRDFPFSPVTRQLTISSDAERRIVLLRDSSGVGPATLDWLSGADGSTVRSRAIPASVDRIEYVPYDANRGAWLLIGDPDFVWVIDADLGGGMRSIRLPEISTGAGSEFGIAYLASRHTLYRVSISVDTLFEDQFESD